MFVRVEQAVEIEARCPLVLGLQDGIGVVQADPPNILSELAVGSHQFLGGSAKPTVRQVNLLDECVVDHRHQFSSPPVCSPSPVLRRSPSALVPYSPDLCPCPSVSLMSTGTLSQLGGSSVESIQHLLAVHDDGLLRELHHPGCLHVASVQNLSTLLTKSGRSYAV